MTPSTQRFFPPGSASYVTFFRCMAAKNRRRPSCDESRHELIIRDHRSCADGIVANCAGAWQQRTASMDWRRTRAEREHVQYRIVERGVALRVDADQSARPRFSPGKI